MKIIDIIHESLQGVKPTQHNYFNNVVEHLTNKFNITQTVKVAFKPPYDLDNEQVGACFGTSKVIFIFIDGHKNHDPNALLLALCHEFIHAHQIARGDLVFEKLHVNLKAADGSWMGEPFVKRKYSRSNEWEVEAHSKERGLRDEMIKLFGQTPG